MALSVFNQTSTIAETGFGKTSTLPSQPALMPFSFDDEKVIAGSFQPGEVPQATYLVQSREFTDDELIQGYHMQNVDERENRCRTCQVVFADKIACDCVQDDEPVMRKGGAELPPPIMSMRPFKFRNAKFFQPDLPVPSELQEMKVKAEHIKTIREAEIRQQLLQRTAGAAPARNPHKRLRAS